MRFYLTVLILFFSGLISAQEFKDSYIFDVNYFTGNVLSHAPDIAHLITGHPEGILLDFSKKTHGAEEWQSVYNYPDYGGYFLYQDFKNEFLGKNYAIGVHYNFYFFKRNLGFKIAQGVAMTTKPHNNVTNSKNGAFGSKILANINLGLNYKTENIIDNVGFQTGILFTHFSNGRIKSPNSGINTYNISFGVNYNFDKIPLKHKDTVFEKINFRQPIKYNIVLRTGVNESPIVGSGLHPLYHVGFYVDKRLNRKSALQLGTEVFFTNSFKDFIKYQSVAYEDHKIDPHTDYKRVGIFVGHELFINRISLEAQLGYYVYQPYKYDIPIYDRLGIKYYIDNRFFTGFSLKTHGFLAEAFEFVVGVRL